MRGTWWRRCLGPLLLVSAIGIKLRELLGLTSTGVVAIVAVFHAVGALEWMSCAVVARPRHPFAVQNQLRASVAGSVSRCVRPRFVVVVVVLVVVVVVV